MSEPQNLELNGLRTQLDDIDRELVSVFARRLEIVAQIRQAKRMSGTHVFDRSREQQVLKNVDSHADDLGVSRQAVQLLYHAVLESSHAAQGDALPNSLSGTSRHFLIVGGRGRMGQLYHRLLTSRGHHVEVLEKGEPVLAETVTRADVVLVAVPMNAANRVCATLGPLLRTDALLCDINSLKSEICQTLATTCAGEALGTHPMFGPSVGSFRRQKIIFCPVRPGPTTTWFREELGHLGADIVEANAETHDGMMAIVQVLTHFGIMVMGRAVSRCGIDLRETMKFMSPIYRLEVAMIGRLFSQDPNLYQEIMMANPNGQNFRNIFVDTAQSLASAIDREDRAGFQRGFAEAAAYFSDFSGEAMALSDHIIETVMSRA